MMQIQERLPKAQWRLRGIHFDRLCYAFALIGISCIAFALPVLAKEKVTLESLLNEMIDLGHLAEYPEPDFSNLQTSSYDRMSQRPEQSNSWFANFDSGNPLYVGTIKERTPFFEIGPMQGMAPDGYFEKGTKVGISKKFQKFGSYVYAYATLPDGTPKAGNTPQGYVDGRNIENDPQGVVLAEMKGPGAVMHLWCSKVILTAKKINVVNEKIMSIDDLHSLGNLKIFVDGSPKPVIDGPFQAIMTGKWVLSGEKDKSKWLPIGRPLAQEMNGGYSLYFPIPYAKSCKITCQIVPDDFTYHVEYRSYDNATEVQSLTTDQLQQSRKKIESVAVSLAVKQPAIVSTNQANNLSQTIAPGKTATLALPGRDSAVVSLEASTNIRDEKLLRCVLLRGIFDGAETPQIDCPLGDFFGTAPGINPVATLPLRVEASGTMRCFWPMPFRRSAKFEIQNHCTQPVSVSLRAKTAPYKFTPRTMRFHAKWNSGQFPVRPFLDWNFLEVTGKGVMVGDTLTVYNRIIDWWGSGDEKIYVDNDRFPSHFGTGTQDYFGFCSLSRRINLHPYHTRSRSDGPANFGFISLNRIRMLDVIPFRKSLKFDWEVWHCQPFSDEITYAGVGYWYALADSKDEFKPVSKESLARFPTTLKASIVGDGVLLEAEKMEVSAKSPGLKTSEQSMHLFPDGSWSSGAQLWVRPSGPGQFVEVVIPCREAGRYEIYSNFTKAPDYGIASFFINGTQIAGPIDFFNLGRVSSTGDYRLGVAELTKGPNKLRVEINSCNGFANGQKYLVGLDYIRLKRVGK